MSDTSIETIKINGVDYVRADSVNTAVPLSQKRIVIADRGWVFVGDCQDHEDGTVTITNCKNIRRWGTTAGLGELVNGPIAGKTMADQYGTVRALPIAQINVIKGW
jgi:hypothetical protein